MKIIYNRIIPFGKFRCINLFGLLFVRLRGGVRPRITEKTMRHEGIHTAQGKELWWVGFYLLYLMEWIRRLFISSDRAYRMNCFEQEAYRNQSDIDYLKTRKRVAWRKYWKVR